MGIIIFIAILVLIFIIIAVSMKLKDDKKTKFMRHFAGLLKDSFNIYEVEGAFKNHHVKIKNSVKDNADWIELEITAPKQGGYVFSVIGRNKKYEKKSTDFISGDERFDNLILVTTKNKRRTAALLTEEIRKKILHYTECSYNFKITNEKLFFNDDFDHHSKWLDKIIELLKFSDSISKTDTVDDLLVDNITNDSNPMVRQLNMTYLMKSKNLEKYKDVFKNLQDSPDKKICVMASYALRDRERLIKFLNSGNRDIIIFTLKYLNKYSNAADFFDSIYKLFNSDDPGILTNAVRLLKRQEGKNSLKEIEGFINKKEKIIDKYDELKIIISEYFKLIKNKTGYKWLTHQLEKDNDANEVTLSIFNSLLSLNNINAVEYLMPYTKGFHSDEIKKAASDAITKLQKNLSSSDRGNLAVMETGLGGEVSMDDTENKGDLSLEE